jgi:hypothetical protein
MKNRNLFSITILLMGSFLISCGSPTPKATEEVAVEAEKSTQDLFFERFKQLEGKKFPGKEVYIQEGRESWSHLELEMYVREWTEDVVYVPFRVGDNNSRTWTIFRQDDNRLWLRHDHRHEDGTPEDVTMYGGFTTDGSDSFKQLFPADEYTCELISYACDNEWTMMFDEEMTTFSYMLAKSGVLVIRVDFDLTSPVE